VVSSLLNKKHGKVRPPPGAITALRVVLPNRTAAKGRLVGANFSASCVIGRSGVTARKHEGDGASPSGRLRILRGYYRPDRWRVRPVSRLPLRPIGRRDGWSDDSRDPAYNRPVTLPRRFSHEILWREDGLYDLVLVLGWNIAPRARGRGSAIFLHLARPDVSGTAGCVALRPADLRRLLLRIGPASTIRIG
jgi:L,D-peptidoglycan transpeptidase YkuD (ErfK/YbiS/YcfS/YnhG family)